MSTTSTDLDLADDILVLHGRIRRTLLAAKSDDVTASQSAVLGRLVRDGAQSTADLARAEGVRPQSMGATVQALVDLDYVVREADPSDGRKTVVGATPAGETAYHDAREHRARLLAARLAALPAADRATVARSVAVLGDLIDP